VAARLEPAALRAQPCGVIAATEELGCLLECVPVSAIAARLGALSEPLVHELAEVLLERGEELRTEERLEPSAR
jgi:hypothetical protein